MWSLYLGQLKRHPLRTNMWSAGLLGFGGDVICQTLEGFEEFDWRRNLAMSIFSVFYMGAFVTPVYAAYPRMVRYAVKPLHKKPGKLMEGLGSSFIDNAFHSPLLYIPAFYVSVGVMQGESLAAIEANLRGSWWVTVKACWLIWVPAQTLNFSVVPVPQRVLFMNGCCLVWNVILDFISHEKEGKPPAAAAEEHAAEVS